MKMALHSLKSGTSGHSEKLQLQKARVVREAGRQLCHGATSLNAEGNPTQSPPQLRKQSAQFSDWVVT